MDDRSLPPPKRQSVTTDKFLYFFMGLRKGEIRRRVAALRAHHPDEAPERLARRLIASHTPLSFLGGALLAAPVFIPGIGPVMKILGIAGGTTVLMRMHMALVLEIALLFGRDIDEQARVREMVAVMAAAGLGSSAPVLAQRLPWKPWYALATGAIGVTALGELIGEAAIRYYAREVSAPVDVPSQPAGTGA